MKVRYSRRATGDLASIYHYLSERSVPAARRVLTGIYASIEFIRRNPHGSEKTNIEGVRVKVVRMYRFKIFYRTLGHDNVVRNRSRPPHIAQSLERRSGITTAVSSS